MEYFILGTMSRPCWDQIWANFTSKPKRALKCSSLSQWGLRPMSMEYVHFRAMYGPCWDHVFLSFTSKSARALKFAGVSQHVLFYMCLECLFSRTMLEPCLVQSFFQTSQSTEIFIFESTQSKAHAYGVLIFWTMLGPCLAYFYFQTEMINTKSSWSDTIVYGVSIFGDHVGTVFCLAIFPDKPELWYFQD